MITFLLGLSWAACGFPKRGPITVQADGQLISNVEITAPPRATAGMPSPSPSAAIDLNGHSLTSIDNVIIHHADKPGIDVRNGHDTLIQNAMIDGTLPNSGVNIACLNSPGLWVSNSRLSRGGSGVNLSHCDGAVLSDLEGHDQTGAYPGGQFVAWQNSANGSLQNFSNVNVEPNASAGDTVNAWRSRNIRISGGLLDGNFAVNGVGIQADEGTTNFVVTDVDAVHMLNGGFGAYGAGGHSILFANVRTRDMLCSSSQGPPSSGGIAFIGPCTKGDPACTLGGKWNTSFDSAVYWNLCTASGTSAPSYNAAAMTRADIRMADFVPRPAFKAALCQ